ncbi:hypothetical protein B0H11DRAFT_2074311 [Mycena galericulata]|nr:hypothetical protein B0H11DRAFT_2074311 [Mycena galericulata]
MASNEKPLPERGPVGLNHLRGTPITSVVGLSTFALGRLADAPLQYFIFTEGWAVKGLTAVGLRASNLLISTGPGVAGLGPIPTLLTGMYAVAGLRHAYWITFTNNHNWTASDASAIVVYNFLINTVNTLVAVNALTYAPYPILGTFTECIGYKQWTGLALFAVGILMELVSEESRKKFKKDPKNKGKIDDTGLWGFVRHPNYLGYTLWRAGITLVTGSLTATAILTAFQLIAFYTAGVPGLTNWMSTKYDQQWTDYTKRVPYAVIPGIW